MSPQLFTSQLQRNSCCSGFPLCWQLIGGQLAVVHLQQPTIDWQHELCYYPATPLPSGFSSLLLDSQTVPVEMVIAHSSHFKLLFKWMIL